MVYKLIKFLANVKHIEIECVIGYMIYILWNYIYIDFSFSVGKMLYVRNQELNIGWTNIKCVSWFVNFVLMANEIYNQWWNRVIYFMLLYKNFM